MPLPYSRKASYVLEAWIESINLLWSKNNIRFKLNK